MGPFYTHISRRAIKLIKATENRDPLTDTTFADTCKDVLSGNAEAFLGCNDALNMLSELPEESVDLVLTDPPHSDRMPYLELSELWNIILGKKPAFEDELVISNAKERSKTKKEVHRVLAYLFVEVNR